MTYTFTCQQFFLFLFGVFFFQNEKFYKNLKWTMLPGPLWSIVSFSEQLHEERCPTSGRWIRNAGCGAWCISGQSLHAKREASRPLSEWSTGEFSSTRLLCRALLGSDQTAQPWRWFDTAPPSTLKGSYDSQMKCFWVCFANNKRSCYHHCYFLQNVLIIGL